MEDKKTTFSPVKLLIIIAVASLFLQFGIGMQRTIYNNFISEELHIEAQSFGVIESIREVPGLLTIVLAAGFAIFTESIAMSLCILLLAAGLIMYGQATGFASLILATSIYSTGFHMYLPVQSSMVLRLSNPGEKGRRLGEMESIRAFGGFLAMGFVILTANYLNYRMMFLVTALITALGAGVMLLFPRDKSNINRRQIVFRKKYWLYYLLIFLSGSRMHIYQAFATYALVNVFNIPVRNMALLLGVSNAFAMITRPIIGRVIDQMGERKALTINYACVIIIFLGYAYVKYLPLLYLIYILDNASMGVTMAISTFLDKIAPREDVPSSLAMGSTIQHIAGVTVPTLGGLIWQTFGYQYTFFAGAVVAVFSLLATQKIDAVRDAIKAEQAAAV